jgi:hypothetical protein
LLGGRGEALAQQGGAALRDSLAHATDVLAYHPDSVDLRLKKAAWNIQLEQCLISSYLIFYCLFFE